MAIGPEMHHAGVQGSWVPIISSSNFEGCVRLSTKACSSLLSSVKSADSPLTGWEDVTTLNVQAQGNKKDKRKYTMLFFKMYICDRL